MRECGDTIEETGGGESGWGMFLLPNATCTRVVSLRSAWSIAKSLGSTWEVTASTAALTTEVEAEDASSSALGDVRGVKLTRRESCRESSWPPT